MQKKGRGQKSKAGAIDKIIGNELFFLRENLKRENEGFKQEDIAKKLGISVQQYQKYEQGVNKINISFLLDIFNALGVVEQKKNELFAEIMKKHAKLTKENN